MASFFCRKSCWFLRQMGAIWGEGLQEGLQRGVTFLMERGYKIGFLEGVVGRG